jgi:hypothetical protein
MNLFYRHNDLILIKIEVLKFPEPRKAKFLAFIHHCFVTANLEGIELLKYLCKGLISKQFISKLSLNNNIVKDVTESIEFNLSFSLIKLIYLSSGYCFFLS